MKRISFLSENFQFLEMKFSIYLNRRVFVMRRSARASSMVQHTFQTKPEIKILFAVCRVLN